MEQEYPKYQFPSFDEIDSIQDCHRVPRVEPEGMDKAKTYTDMYNIPHDPPERPKR